MEKSCLITVITIFLPLLYSCQMKPTSREGGEVQNEKPNVIIINTDDLGYGDVSSYGATKVNTPHIDQLAREGRKFTDVHSASAVCSPSRYALITGQYPSRKGNLWGPLFLRTPMVIDTAQMTVARVMKEAGYATACIGKWHLGFGNEHPVDWNKDLKPGPLELGFDYYFGVPVLNSHPPFVYVENHKVVGLTPDDPFVYGEKAETQEFQEKFALSAIGGAKAAHALYDDRKVGTTLKDKAIEWIRAKKNEPFFLYFATTNIHHPFTPAPQFEGTSDAGRYGDFIHELDWMIGEVMAAVDEEGLRDNTLVIFTSDNGGMLNQGGQDAWRAGHKLNGDLLGFKFGAWEGGHRVPFIARWPGVIPAGSISDELISNVDILATLAALVDYPLKKGEGPDSYNILPALRGMPAEPVRDHLVISPAQKKNLAIRKGKWMYISSQNEGGFGGTKIGAHTLGGAAAHKLTGQVNSDIENGKVKPDAAPAQLYDLEADPTQKVNVYYDYPEVAQELKALLEETMDRGASVVVRN
jgi:arylsulfatase A